MVKNTPKQPVAQQTPSEQQKLALANQVIAIENKRIELQSKAQENERMQLELAKQRDDNLYNSCKDVHAKEIQKAKIIAGVVCIIGVMIVIFLLACVYTHQITFFSDFFKDIALIFAGGLGGWGIGRKRS